VGQVETHFGPFGESVNLECDKNTLGFDGRSFDERSR
jgi:hypothetical protein